MVFGPSAGSELPALRSQLTGVMMTDDTYNGWTNRETWLASLWISNEQGTYEASREVVRDAVEEWEPMDVLADYYADPDNRREGLVTAAAEALESWADDTFAPDLDGFVSDLFSTAWSRIDWREIADGMVNEMESEGIVPTRTTP